MPRDAENLKQWQAGARVRLRADPVRHARYKTYLSDRHRERSADDPAYVEARRARSREYMRQLRTTPDRREYDRQYARRAREQDIVKALVKSARGRAKSKSIPFSIDIETLRLRWTGKCEITGLPFVVAKGHQGIYSPSIDRIDPALGYVDGNCRFILASINWFKSSGTDADVLRIARAIVANMSEV